MMDEFPDVWDASAGSFDFESLIGANGSLARKLRTFDPLQMCAAFASLLTIPDLQSNCYRLEAAVHLALALCDGAQGANASVVSALFTALGAGAAGRMEDPAEDVFVSSVATLQGNFRVLEGTWESAGFYLQRAVNTLEMLPATSPYDDMRAQVSAVLRLSDLLCERADLSRNQLGNENPLDKIPHPILSTIRTRSALVKFSERDLAEKGIAPENLASFCFDFTSRQRMRSEKIGQSALERFPLLYYQGSIYVLLPSAITIAIRRFLLERMGTPSLRAAFLDALSLEYANVFGRIPLLGGRSAGRIEFCRSERSLLAGIMRSIDEGIHLNVVFFIDMLTDYGATGFAGFGSDTPEFADDLQAWVNYAYEQTSQTSGFRAGLSLVVGCGLGRGFTSTIPKVDAEKWRVEFISAHDFYTLSWVPNFKPLSLFRLFRAEDELQNAGVRLFNLNGLLNQVAWMRLLKGHLVPHGQLPEGFGESAGPKTIMIQQNALRGLRYEVARHFDPHVAQSIDGSWLAVRKTGDMFFEEDARRPFFVTEDRVGPWPMGIYETNLRAWWSELQTRNDTDGAVAYERAKIPNTWLCRAVPVLEAELPELPNGALLWRVRFTASLGTRAKSHAKPMATYEDALASITIEVSDSEPIVTQIVSEDFEDALSHPDNIAERAFVARMVDGFASLARANLTEQAKQNIVSQIVPDGFARQAHVLRARTFRDFIRDKLPPALKIDEDNDALIKFGLGWRVRRRAEGADIHGKQQCKEYLNSVVALLEDEVCEELRQFDRRAILEFALMNHESCAAERDIWRRTAAAVISLHDDKEAARQTHADHDYSLNAVFQATRLIAEFAACECPVNGGSQPGRLDVSRLMSKVLLISSLGGWSDAIHYDAMEPHIRVTPLGDIHANLSFQDEILAPYGRAGNDVRVDDDIERYAEHYEEYRVARTGNNAWPDAFREAFQEEFGASFDEVRIFIDGIEDFALKEGSVILALRRSQLLRVVVREQSLSSEVANTLIDRLLFPSRPHWRTVPPGYSDKDRFPWRYRRSLSLLRKPLLNLDEADDPTIILAPGFLREAFVYMLACFHKGDFPLHQLKPKMLKWAGQSKDNVGHAFNKLVANRLQKLGWHAKFEVKLTELLQRKLDQDYGDVDVVAWNATTGRILLIECKDLQYRKAYGEIAEQLADFRGAYRSNGRPDDLLKHLKRVDMLRDGADILLRSLKVDQPAQIESHLVFKNPVPMRFAFYNLKERVLVHIFSELDNL